MRLFFPIFMIIVLSTFFVACNNTVSPLQQSSNSNLMQSNSTLTEKLPEQPSSSHSLYTLNGGSWSNIIAHPYTVTGDATIENLANGLSELTGLNFAINDATISGNNAVIDWSSDSTLIAGLGDTQQKDEFFVYENVSLNWLMMDSLYLTVINNFDVDNIYYTMNGGQPLNLPDMGTDSIFPLENPYYASPYYFGDVDYFSMVNINKAIYNTAGIWHIDGDENAARIEFNGMGSYVAFYADNNVESQGYMAAVDANENGLYSFNLYDEYDEFFTTIEFVNENSFITDIHTYNKTHTFEVG